MVTDLLARKYRFNVPGTKANSELDTANSALDRKAPFEPDRARANAVNSTLAGENTKGVISIGERRARTFRRPAEMPSIPMRPMHTFAKVRDGGAPSPAREARALPKPLYALFSIGAPTLLPHSVHEPS